MAPKTLLFVSLHLAGIWAQSSTGSCLDPHTFGAANKESCCSGSGNGEAAVGSVLYEYTCNSYANNYGAAPLGAPNAYACAELCTKDSSCHASSWQPNAGGAGGDCWLSTAGFTLTPDPYNLWVILVNTNRAGHVVNPGNPEVDCEKSLEEVRNTCTAETELLKEKYNALEDAYNALMSAKELCDANLSSCKGKASQCNSDLDTCNGKVSEVGGELKTCNAGATKCGIDLKACKDAATPKPPPQPQPSARCPKDHGGYQTIRGVRYQILCDQGIWAPADKGQINNVPSALDCIERCSTIAGCNSASWAPELGGACRLRTVRGATSTLGGWVLAIRA